MMSKLTIPVFTLILFSMFSSVFYISAKQKQQDVVKLRINEIEKQVALDLPLLDLSNKLLKHVGNKEAIDDYIKKLNGLLPNNNVTLKNITPASESTVKLALDESVSYLRANNGHVLLIFNTQNKVMTVRHFIVFTILFVLSICLSMWLKLILVQSSHNTKHSNLSNDAFEHAPFSLIIDLNSKTLSSSYAIDLQTSLANKPLCFYLALVEFCERHSDSVLNQNKNVPDELVELANKYFHRLVELGHTVRKRPNFNSSLEKTLSEIRAALDEVLNDYPDQKDIYYPPKAYGEGSRSRLHSYGLVNIDKGHIEIIGK